MLQSSLKFLKALEKNNNKPWFEKNRGQYDTVKAEFAAFTQQLIDQHGKKDPTIKGLLAKDCTFRINRDVRFSKDKSPYKNNFGAYISRGGKKSPFAGYYFQVQPGRCFVGGGLWMPMPAELNKVRQEIDYNFNDLKKIIHSKKFRSVYGDLSKDSEYTLTRLPKGYEGGNPAESYLRLKSFVALHFFKETDLASNDLLKKTLAAFEALQPLLTFINEAVQAE